MLLLIRLLFFSFLTLFIIPVSVAFIPFHKQKAHQTHIDRRFFFSASSPDESMETTNSLAGSYLIQCQKGTSKCTWSLIPLSDVVGADPAFSHSDGARALAALHSTTSQPQGSMVLHASVKGQEVHISCTSDKDGALVSVLSRILAQWTVAQGRSSESADEFTIHLLDDTMVVSDIHADETVRRLFQDDSELVEMVDHSANCLGKVPRKMVHTHNLLHRGIGLFVTKDQPLSSDSRPDLYVHRRTDTKRIFPSLYDMFVGGVSLAGEAPIVTARREVAEELGLTEDDHLSNTPVLACAVCTAYNRCVVDLFCYTMNTLAESITWQEEEVAWGAFVPYSVIEAAADLSIQRLTDRKEWPGQYPPIQSPREGVTPLEYDEEDWRRWDFVPDGLLVWEAWLRSL